MGRAAKIKAARRDANAVGKVLRRNGVFNRIEAVNRAMVAPDFSPRFRARLTQAESDVQVKDITELQRLLMRFLGEDMGLDVRDVQIFIDWQPDLGRKMTFSFAPTVAATQYARDIVEGNVAEA